MYLKQDKINKEGKIEWDSLKLKEGRCPLPSCKVSDFIFKLINKKLFCELSLGMCINNWPLSYPFISLWVLHMSSLSTYVYVIRDLKG